jgi:hypothetical protein
MCGIAIKNVKKRSEEIEVKHDDIKETDEMKLMKVDREVMDVLKFVLDGEFADEDLLPEPLKMNKGKLVKGILTLISRVVACDVKIDKLERKLEKYKSRYYNTCDSLLNDNYKIICTMACFNFKIKLLKSNMSCDSCVGMLA